MAAVLGENEIPSGPSGPTTKGRDGETLAASNAARRARLRCMLVHTQRSLVGLQ